MGKFSSGAICIFTCFILSCTSHSSDQTSSDFGWLSGKWERVGLEVDQSAFETWTVSEDGNLLGNGIFMNGADTVFQEKMNIQKRNDNWFFVADVPENEAPVFFKLVEFSDNGFIAENPEHDFPTKIEYVLTNAGDGIKATVSGGEKSINFKFRKSK